MRLLVGGITEQKSIQDLLLQLTTAGVGEQMYRMALTGIRNEDLKMQWKNCLEEAISH